MEFKQWLTEELKSDEQKSFEEAQTAERQKKASEDAREKLLLEWCRDAYRLFQVSLEVLTTAKQQVSITMSNTEPALNWANGRKLELVRQGRFQVEVRRENARKVAVITSDEIEDSGAPVLTDEKDDVVLDAETVLRPLILGAAKK